MARIRNAHVIERMQVASRASPPVAVERNVLTGLSDAKRGVSAATHDVISRLGQAVQGVTQDRLATRFQRDKQTGAEARTNELLGGAAVQQEDALAQYRPAFRHGYLLTEGANRVAQVSTELTRKMAAMEPDEDPSAAIQETLAPLMQNKAFNDPAVRQQLHQSVEGLRQSAVETYRKNELAEMLERQQENLASLARIGIQDRTLWSQEGVDKFREQLNTEQFAYLSADEADNIVATAMADLIETGEVDPAEAQGFLQGTKSGDGVPLWDRKDSNGNRWADHFDNAVKAGSAVRQRATEEKRAEVQAAKEHEWVGLAYRGGFSPMKINAEADRLGLSGGDRLAFVRRWESQNHAGLERLRREAEEAERHRKTLEAMQMGNHLQHTNAQLQKAASEEWAKAMASGDIKASVRVIAQFTRAGVVIPQLRDLLNSPTANNMPRLKDLYENLSKIDPVVADRYLTDDNAALLMSYTRDLAGGSNAAEAIQNLPVGAKKAERREAAETINRAYTHWSKDQPETLKDGVARPPWLAAEVRQRATQMLANNAGLRPEDALAAAERQAVASTETINGVLVRPGALQRGAAAFVTQHVMDVEKELGDTLPSEFRGKLYAAPDQRDGRVFNVLSPQGFPLINPKTGDFIRFDPNEVAAARHRYATEKAAHDLKFNNAETLRRGIEFMGTPTQEAAERRTSKGTGPTSTYSEDEINRQRARQSGVTLPGQPDLSTAEGRRAANQFPDFATWASSRK